MHIVFLEYSHQDFTVLYASLGLSVIVGVLFHKILFTRRVRPRWINISIITMSCLMVVEYWIMNSSLVHKKEETSINYSLLKVASKNKDLVLFIEKKKLDVIQTYYLKRNVLTVQRKEMAISFLRLHHYNEGLITNDGTYLNTKE